MSIESLLGKLSRANDCFSDSMGKVENMSLNLRHFLIFNTEKAETQQNLLTSIENCINDLTQKTEIITESIRKNESHIVTLGNSIAEFKEFRSYTACTPDQCTENTSTDKKFLIDQQNNRVLRQNPPIALNPTEHICISEENILTPEHRSSICQFLDQSKNFVSRPTMQELYLGKPHWRITKKSNSKHDQQEIPPAFQSIIDMLHDKFSISDEQKLNSIVIQKFSCHRAELREQSHSNPLINPDSTIFNICLGDSCSVTFRNKCSNDTVNLDTVDNSHYSMSYKSQLY